MILEGRYILLSGDKQEFEVSQKIIAMSVLLKNMVEQLNGAHIIPIPDVDGNTLKKVLDFCKKYEDEPEYIPPKAGDPNNQLPDRDSWEMKFLYIPQDKLMEMMNAANYLNIPRLIDACCYRMALMIEGRGVEEIRKILMIENDFTKKEEEQMRRDHIWYDFPLSENLKPFQDQ